MLELVFVNLIFIIGLMLRIAIVFVVVGFRVEFFMNFICSFCYLCFHYCYYLQCF